MLDKVLKRRKIFSAFKIPVYLDFTLLFAASLLVYTLGIAWGVTWFCVIYTSILLHELSHALVARRFGAQTSGIVLHYFGGAASVNLEDMTPRQEALISVAGPIANGLIGYVSLVLYSALNRYGDQSLLTLESIKFLYLVAGINFISAIFNLLPIFPLDGGRIFRAMLQYKLDYNRATKIAMNVGPIVSASVLVFAIFKAPGLIFISAILLLFGIFIRVKFNDNKSLRI